MIDTVEILTRILKEGEEDHWTKEDVLGMIRGTIDGLKEAQRGA